MIEINKMVFTDETTKEHIKIEEVQNVLELLKSIVGSRMLKYFLPTDRDFISDYEYFRIRALCLYLYDLQECKGFFHHLNEYKNNFDTTFFVSQFASYLLAHNLEVELESNIPNQDKKPDIIATQNNLRVYFECKRPLQSDLEDEHKYMFNSLNPFITNQYSLTLFYSFMPTQEDLSIIGNQIKERTKDLNNIKENDVLFENDDMEVKIVLSGLMEYDQNTEAIFTGIPVFNHFGYNTATCINSKGRNIVFYKRATSNIIENQLNKTLGKVPVGSNYIVVISTDDRRIDTKIVKGTVERLLTNNVYSSISGVVIIDTILSETYDFGIEFIYIENKKSLIKNSWLGEFLHNRVIKEYKSFKPRGDVKI